jgi:CRP-like cAMP-binding protein/predicted MFS family arabinose efflux permease
MSSRGPTLGNKSLRRLLAGFGLLNVAEWGFVAAFSVLAFRVGGALDVGLIGLRFLAGAVSSAVFAPMLAGRRGVLSQIALVRAVLLGCAAVLALSGGQFLLLLAFVVADSIVAAAYRPAQSRLMPALASSPEELMQAVAGTSMAKTIGQAAGALIAGGAVEFVSPRVTMVGEAGVMLLALFCTLGIDATPATTRSSEPQKLRDGMAMFPSVLSDADAWPLVWASVLRTLVRGLWGALLVVVVLHMLHAGDSSVGLMQAATGLGALVALPVTAAQIGRARLALPCVLSFVGAGIAIGLISAKPPLLIVAVLVFVWGASMALADATSISLLHRLLSSDAFSRTVAVMESLKLVSEGAGALLAPALVALFGLRPALVIAGLPLPILMVATWVRVRRSDELAAGRGMVVRLLHRVSLFRGLDMASLEQLAALSQPIDVPSGEEPVTQGDHGDRFYVIDSGDAEVLINGHKVREIGPGDDFGERALLRDTPRTATVRALSDMHLLAIEREAFLEALTGEAGITVQPSDLLTVPLVDVLATLPALAGVGDDALNRLARGARRETLDSGAVVLDVGDQSSAVYVMLRGRVELHDGERVTAVFLAGDAFGELSVLHGSPCPGRVTVTEPTIVDVLPAATVLAAVGGEPAPQA